MITFILMSAGIVLIFFIVGKISQKDISSADIPNCNEQNKRSCIKNIIGFCMANSVFLIIGILMLVGSFLLKTKEERYINDGKPATAVIVDIRDYEVLDNDGYYDDVRDVYLNYTVDEIEYENVIKNADLHGIAVGETLEIYYSADDPTDFICSENIRNRLDFTVPAGIVLIALPFVMHLLGSLMQKRSSKNPHI